MFEQFIMPPSVCFAIAVSFCLLAALFAIFKGKVAILVTGFNTLSKQEQEQYDRDALSAGMRNKLLIWAIIFFVGGVAALTINPHFSALALIIWLVLFFSTTSFDPEKAFGKYKRK